jgi:hypothetical protein
MATKNRLQKVLELAGQFVIDHKDGWTHDEWESLLEKIADLGADLKDDGKQHLGVILESCKALYFDGVGEVAQEKKSAANPKAKAKAKPKAKA